MKRNRSAGDWKSLVMIGSMGKEGFLFPGPPRPKDLPVFFPLSLITASWVGLFTVQQYSAAKHGVLGLMRSLDTFAESDDIRTACIHPWFTGKAPLPLLILIIIVVASDTNIIDWKSKALSVGMPMTPVERVAGAMFRAATDPDRATSGCPWMLPDDGPVLLLKKEVLNEGVYEMLNKRISRIIRYRMDSSNPPPNDAGRNTDCTNF